MIKTKMPLSGKNLGLLFEDRFCLCNPVQPWIYNPTVWTSHLAGITVCTTTPGKLQLQEFEESAEQREFFGFFFWGVLGPEAFWVTALPNQSMCPAFCSPKNEGDEGFAFGPTLNGLVFCWGGEGLLHLKEILTPKTAMISFHNNWSFSAGTQHETRVFFLWLKSCYWSPSFLIFNHSTYIKNFFFIIIIQQLTPYHILCQSSWVYQSLQDYSNLPLSS